MHITIKEMLKLEKFKAFKCIAGSKGFNRKIEKISFLDYEVIEPLKWKFFEHEFALSSLLAAKDDPSLILESVKFLFDSGVSGLAIKNIYFDTLPEEVIDFGNDNNFPIFIFDNSVFFEDLTTDVRDLLRDLERNKERESKLDLLMEGELTERERKRFFNELTNFYDGMYVISYFKSIEKINSIYAMKIVKDFSQKYTDAIIALIPYQNGFLILYNATEFKITELLNDCQYIGLQRKDCIVGVSSICKDSNELKNGLIESIWSAKVAAAENEEIITYESIGAYKLLQPIIDTEIANSFLDEIIIPLQKYDKKHSAELFQTAEVFINEDGQIAQTARVLFIHGNTIRYRINKIKQLLGFEDKEVFFFEHLSLAFRIYKIKTALF